MESSIGAGALPQRPVKTRRVVELDALRGLAAASVVFYHWRITFVETPAPWFLVPFTSGLEAVILFFVLSGYVLAIPFWSGKVMPYPEFLVRRVSRIYLPYLGALVLAAVGCYFFYGSRLPLHTSYFQENWREPVSARMLLRHVRMDTMPSLNVAFWTLRYEMIMSLVFPGICAVMRKFGRFSGVYLVVLLRVLSLLLGLWLTTTDLPYAIYIAIFFVAGAELARERLALLALVGRIRTPVLWVILAVTMLVYFNRRWVSLPTRSAAAATAVAVLILILLAQDPRLRLGLGSKVPQYLGRISYSLYLVHGVVMLSLLNLLYGRIGMVPLSVVCLSAAFAVAHVFCAGVEEPSMNLGKRVASWMQRRASAGSVPLLSKPVS